MDVLKSHHLPWWPHGRGNRSSEKPDLNYSCQHFPSPCCSTSLQAPRAAWSPVKLLGQSELEGVLWQPAGVLWSLLGACLANRKERGNELKKALWNSDISVLNFYHRGSQFCLLGKFVNM